MSGRSALLDQALDLADGVIELIVDDEDHVEFERFGLLLGRFGKAGPHLLLGISAPTKAGFLGLVRRSIDEDEQGVGVAMSDLLGAVHIDLEQNVVTRRRIRHRGSLVVVEKFDPLEEAVVGDMGEKSLCVGEVVGLHCLTGPTVTSGPAPREPQGGVFVKERGQVWR